MLCTRVSVAANCKYYTPHGRGNAACSCYSFWQCTSWETSRGHSLKISQHMPTDYIFVHFENVRVTLEVLNT